MDKQYEYKNIENPEELSPEEYDIWFKQNFIFKNFDEEVKTVTEEEYNNRIKKELEDFEKYYNEEDTSNSKFAYTDNHIEEAFDLIQEYMYENTGANISWIRSAIAKHGNKKSAQKYTIGDREFYCEFLSNLMRHGASQNQSIYLLIDLLDNNMAHQGLYREITDTFKEYKDNNKIDLSNFTPEPLEVDKNETYYDEGFLNDLMYYSKKHNISLENKQKSFKKALDIYEAMWANLFYTFKNIHERVIKECRYRGEFGDLTKLLNKEYTSFLIFAEDFQSIWSDDKFTDFNELICNYDEIKGLEEDEEFFFDQCGIIIEE